MEIIKTLHGTFFLLCNGVPARKVTVKLTFLLVQKVSCKILLRLFSLVNHFYSKYSGLLPQNTCAILKSILSIFQNSQKGLELFSTELKRIEASNFRYKIGGTTLECFNWTLVDAHKNVTFDFKMNHIGL